MGHVLVAKEGRVLMSFEINRVGGKYLIKEYIDSKLVRLTTLSSDEMTQLSKSLKEAGF